MNWHAISLLTVIAAMIAIGATAKALRYEARFSSSPDHGFGGIERTLAAAGWHRVKEPYVPLLAQDILPQRVFAKPGCPTPIVVSILHSGPQLIPFLRQSGFDDLAFLANGQLTPSPPVWWQPARLSAAAGEDPSDLPLLAIAPAQALRSPHCKLA